MSRVCSILAGIVLALVAGAAAAAESGKEKAAPCAACHGVDGNSSNPTWPNLAGQHAAYTVDQLRAFKSGGRQNASMAPMVEPLSEQDMRDIAEYYARQEPRMGVADDALVALGESIYRGGNGDTGVPACMACHGPDGSGNAPAGYPRLSGQHPEYTVTQLRAYKDGARDTDPEAMMRTISSRMSAEEIEAVASYVAGLH